MVWTQNVLSWLVCLSSWFLGGSALWEDCGTFRRWRIMRGSVSLGQALGFYTWPQATSCSIRASDCGCTVTSPSLLLLPAWFPCRDGPCPSKTVSQSQTFLLAMHLVIAIRKITKTPGHVHLNHMGSPYPKPNHAGT